MRVQLLVPLVGTLVLTSCDPMQADEGLFCVNRIEQDDDPFFGEMSALLNGEPWIVSPLRGRPYAQTSYEGEMTMSILMFVYDGERGGEYKEGLHIPGIPRRLGTYSLPLPGVREDGVFFGPNLYGADVLGLFYVLDRSGTGFISIDAYDPSTCTIQGTFSFTVVSSDPGGMYPYPYVDTLRFSEGRFHTHVVTWPGAR